MKALGVTGRRVALAALALLAAGCASSGSTATPGSVYAGSGFHDPWHWGPVYREVPVVVGPPAAPAHPIAPPPAVPAPARTGSAPR
jgi:hypothetical protein